MPMELDFSPLSRPFKKGAYGCFGYPKSICYSSERMSAFLHIKCNLNIYFGEWVSGPSHWFEIPPRCLGVGNISSQGGPFKIFVIVILTVKIFMINTLPAFRGADKGARYPSMDSNIALLSSILDRNSGISLYEASGENARSMSYATMVTYFKKLIPWWNWNWPPNLFLSGHCVYPLCMKGY